MIRERKQRKTGRVKLIDSHIVDGKVLYFITADGIEFYLDTKEIKDESKINVQQLLLEKMIVGENFRGGIEVVRRINSEVNRLIREKDEISKSSVHRRVQGRGGVRELYEDRRQMVR